MIDKKNKPDKTGAQSVKNTMTDKKNKPKTTPTKVSSVSVISQVCQRGFTDPQEERFPELP
jgi:hypothetical protein